jgi:hypothetical protein
MENLGVQYEAMETIFKSADIISLSIKWQSTW